MSIDSLIEQKESEHLDFKEVHHSDTLSLLHDILCLSNAWAESDRYLLFGVTDTGVVTGVESDPNRRKGSNIQDLLRASRLNRLPTLSMQTHEVNGHEVDVLTIRNRPDKPFFVTTDKEYHGRTIRAGVVYTRIGDTNVPMKESATEASIELAWRERFGLGLPPLVRAFRLLKEPEKWESVAGEQYQYHRDFPEFTVVEERTLVESFSEPWTAGFPDKSARSYAVQIRYGTTILKELVFVTCDGGRYSLPLPRRVGDAAFELNRNSLAWRVMQLYRQYFPAETTLTGAGVTIADGPSDDG